MTDTANTVVELASSVRSIARQQNIDLNGLMEILQQRRPDKSKTEDDFVADLATKLNGAQSDSFGNLYLTIGKKPNVMWSCHTDTVSKDGGRQNLKWNGDVLSLNQGKAGQSLGADDGAGLWLLLEMIKANKEGLYVFHRAEEVGRLGSKWISKNTPGLLEGIDIAIAFDRRGTDSIITHQSSRRTCSDAFADKLGEAFGANFKKDPTGSYTDTYSYVDQIAECTNVSVGYYKEHGPMETLDVAHLFKLREALLALDTATLPVERDASKTEWDDDRWGQSTYGSYGGYGGYGSASKWAAQDAELDTMIEMLKTHPRSIARWLQDANYTPDIMCALIGNHIRPFKPTANKSEPTKSAKDSANVFGFNSGKSKEGGSNSATAAFSGDEDLAGADEVDVEPNVFYEPGIYCDDCGEAFESSHDADVCDGDDCPNCFGRNTRACEVALDAVSGEVLSEVQ